MTAEDALLARALTAVHRMLAWHLRADPAFRRAVAPIPRRTARAPIGRDQPPERSVGLLPRPPAAWELPRGQYKPSSTTMLRRSAAASAGQPADTARRAAVADLPLAPGNKVSLPAAPGIAPRVQVATDRAADAGFARGILPALASGPTLPNALAPPVRPAVAQGRHTAPAADRPQRGDVPRSRTETERAGELPSEARLEQWLADHLAAETRRPARGATGFDPRLSPGWPGTLQGLSGWGG